MTTKNYLFGILIFLSGVAFPIRAENTGTNPDLIQPVNADRNLIIDSIVIDNRNIFDTNDPHYKHLIFRYANKFHAITRQKVVKRELLFKTGDVYPDDLVEETARNLRNRLSLYDAWIETDTLPSGKLIVRVVTIDEWSLSVGPNFSREGNKNQFELTITERNLLGRNQYISTGYFLKESEKDYENVHFIDNKLWGKSFALDLYHTSNPKNKTNWLILSKPFYHLNQRFSYYLSFNYADKDNEIYRDTLKIGSTASLGDEFDLGVSFRTGSYKNKIEYFTRFAYKYINSNGVNYFSEDPMDSMTVNSNIPNDTAYHLIDIGIKTSFLNFTKQKHIDGMGYIEDFNLGQVLSLSIGRAFKPYYNDYLYDIITLNLWHGFSPGNNIIYVAYNRKHWFFNSSQLRKLSNMSLLFYNHSLDFVTLALHSSYYSDWRADQSESLRLGGVNGIRGYNEYFKTGDRQMVINSEMRFFTGLEILAVKIGSTIFVDAGRSWKADETINFRDFYFSAGVGLRFSIGHASRHKVMRVDFSFSEQNHWQISIGTEQYFHLSSESFYLVNY